MHLYFRNVGEGPHLKNLLAKKSCVFAPLRESLYFGPIRSKNLFKKGEGPTSLHNFMPDLTSLSPTHTLIINQPTNYGFSSL